MSNNEDLLPEQTEGFKVGEKKTIDEYHQMGTFHVATLIIYHSQMLDWNSRCSRMFSFPGGKDGGAAKLQLPTFEPF